MVYRDKFNQRKLSTESGKIAWCIEWIETHQSWNREFRTNNKIDLFDGTVIEDHLTYNEDNSIEIRTYESHYSYSLNTVSEINAYEVIKIDILGDEWTKIIPANCNWKIYNNVLDAQPWKHL